MDPFDFGGQRSQVKVTLDFFGNKLVNMIETKPLCATSSNLADMLAIVRRWTLLILEVRGQRSRSQLTYRNKLVNMIETKPVCYFIKLGRHVSHSEKMDPIDFGGQRSKVKVTIDMYENKLVNII